MTSRETRSPTGSAGGATTSKTLHVEEYGDGMLKGTDLAWLLQTLLRGKDEDET
jgi:hypothetical protein